MQVIDRIEQLLKARGVPERKMRRALSDACGISYEAVRQWFANRNTNIEAQHVLAISKKWDGRLEWLLSGKGSMDKENIQIHQQNTPQIEKRGDGSFTIHNNSISEIETKYGVKRDPYLFEPEPEKKAITLEFVDIPYYQEAELSMGNGTIIHDDEHPGRSLSFQQDWLDSLGLEVEHLVVVKCKGSSMEPRIYGGDVVLINRKIDAIEDGSIYAINYGGDAKLKRLITRADGSLIIRSDNQNGMFPDETITESEADQLKIVGKAVWVGGML